jgi:hypothetical protein
MYVSNVRNVCDALPSTLELLFAEGIHDESREGKVLVLPAPLMTVTAKPRERVLRSPIRDANPFFHMVEAIWMLAGRDDVAPLNIYVKNFGQRYAETNHKIHDAYGRRWRTAFNFDQLDVVVHKLIANPLDRQCVVSMWDPRRMHADGENDLRGTWRTRPCNTHLYLRVFDDSLDMTVCCRSNDMIWGGHGANAVHFSILQEYLAARIDVGMGTMYQLSNNAHVYEAELERIDQRIMSKYPKSPLGDNPYATGEVKAQPMFTEPAAIDEDVIAAMRWHDTPDADIPDFKNEWFTTTFAPAVLAHRVYRLGDPAMAAEVADTISAEDWRLSCVEWLQRRFK